MGIKNEIEEIKGFLFNENVKDFVLSQLERSLSEMGHSKELVLSLRVFFEDLNVEQFQEKFGEDLYRLHDIKFLREMAPNHFKKYVLPYIPEAKKLLDVGCGTGILLRLIEESGYPGEMIGVDIYPYKEWSEYGKSKISFSAIQPGNFKNFLDDCGADGIIMTWVLHHMTYNDQEKYLRELYELDGVNITILEDTYSNELLLMSDIGVNKFFKKLNDEERMAVMSVYDWLANRVFLGRKIVPIPFGFRTMEEWKKLFERIGYKVKEMRYIGFPENRDVYNPQGLFVIQK